MSPRPAKSKIIPIVRMTDEALIKLSRENTLSLSLLELHAIQAYYRGVLRDPTDVELETVAQTWSEHCRHKTIHASIESDEDGIRYAYQDLIKETIMQATHELAKPWCLSVFKDNAGIMEVDDLHAVAFKVETHNHPSALDPYGGANTGIGGVIRDILGAGLGAKPIFNTDVFCVGPHDLPRAKVPAGVLHPARVLKGVVKGVRDYGNRMGIPTINGSIFVDDSYTCNPLVFCGTAGLMPKKAIEKSVKSGDIVVVIGGRTGRDGIHGATFSSAELEKDLPASLVQIGNPITEKKMTDALLRARDEGLYRAITDCGAGGLSSAVGEMGETTGVKVELRDVLLKYEGLSPWEIWLSEAQERMVLAVPPNKLKALLALMKEEGVEATPIGKFTRTRQLEVMYFGKRVCWLDMDFLHHGMPKLKLIGSWKPPIHEDKSIREVNDYSATLLTLLSHPVVASKEWIVRQYDHEVQGRSVIKPLQGARADGPGDASVVRAFPDQWTGIAVSNGMNPWYSQIDPYWMAAAAVDEALRNIIAVGGRYDRTALLDNFCWGRTQEPQAVGSFARTVRACGEVSKQLGIPFISGKDSLNNEFTLANGVSQVILPTLLISAISVVPDIRQCVTMDLKSSGNLLYIIGKTKAELGASLYYRHYEMVGRRLPMVDFELAPRLFRFLEGAITNGWIRACHDCSEGGMVVTMAEMAMAGRIGMQVDLKDLPSDGSLHRADEALFSESQTRWIVEIEHKHRKAFEQAAIGMPVAVVGRTTKDQRVTIRDRKGAVRVRIEIDRLAAAWKRPFQKW